MQHNKKHPIRWVLGGLLLLAIALALVAFLFYGGMLQIHNPSRKAYPVRGVDVSSYQGEITWPVLAAQGIDFAFIKATEGSSHTDSLFAKNWNQANQTHLAVGAYHFFSFDSPGSTQAAHFIKTVPRRAGTLPPVVDFEFYGDKEANPPPREQIEPELRAMLDALEQHYGALPIIYATERSYEQYLAGGYERYPLWIRGVYTHPTLSDQQEWAFWQYSNRKRLKGYTGPERFIDMNAFYGTLQELEAFLLTE